MDNRFDFILFKYFMNDCMGNIFRELHNYFLSLYGRKIMKKFFFKISFINYVHALIDFRTYLDTSNVHRESIHLTLD